MDGGGEMYDSGQRPCSHGTYTPQIFSNAFSSAPDAHRFGQLISLHDYIILSVMLENNRIYKKKKEKL